MADHRPVRGRFTRRALLLGTGAVLGVAGTQAWRRGGAAPIPTLPAALPPGLVLDDASELSATPVASNPILVAPPGPASEEEVAALIRRAGGRSLVPSAARHSMGGQSLARDGHCLTFDQRDVEADPAGGAYRAAAGARWRDVIARLDPLGFSPAVMQSNNDFGVASTFSVNAHGWPVPHSGHGSTVRRVRMVDAGGRALTCSREQNAEVFAAAVGGYGLLGVVTELQVEMVPNRRLAPSFETVPGDVIGSRLREAAEEPGVEMAYGRLDVAHERFFEEGLLVAYRPVPDQDDLPPVSSSGLVSHVSARVFRAQLGDERAKRWRWWVETGVGPRLGGEATRNALLNEPVATLDDRDPTRTDILHEYFVPPDRLGAFLATCRETIPASYQQLLNVTLRYVRADRESLLAYAPDDRVAAVMLFSQEKSARAEADMARVTRALIDGALAEGGSYYLPYRLHATPEQFEAAYPRAREFARLKRRLDPEGRFSNALWTTYLERLA